MDVKKDKDGKVINAFHPLYAKTYGLGMSSNKDAIGREISAKKVSAFVTQKRKKDPTWGFAGDLSKAKKVSLSPKEFLTYSRAGTPTTKRKTK